MSRLAKDNALKAIQNNLDDIETLETIPIEQVNVTPIYTQNAQNGLTLDLCKQYKRKVEFCNRELFRIHNRTINKKDQGSLDRGIVYIDFQAGLFEALKVNFLKCVASDFNILLTCPPKVELFGQAEERICLDLKMVVAGSEHFVKVIVHNTKCSLHVQGFVEKYNKKFDHLDNRTVGLYFAEEIVTKVVKKITDNVDISKLNNHLRNLAMEGKKSASVKHKTKSSTSCNVCGKELKTSASQQCSNCLEKAHDSCMITTIMKCGLCMIYSDRQALPEPVEEDDVIDSLKKDVTLPLANDLVTLIPIEGPQVVELSANETPGIVTPETEVVNVETEIVNAEADKVSNETEIVNDENVLNSIKCSECDAVFLNKDLLTTHFTEKHDNRGAKT